MIKFFRKIRQNLLSEGKTGKYLKYALGEIILVVVGILIALQINNWNERRKQKDIFDLSIEQAYNNIDLEFQNMAASVEIVKNSVTHIESLLNTPDSIPDHKLPYILLYVDHGIDNSETSNFQTIRIASDIRLIHDDFKQLKIAKEIESYSENPYWKTSALSNQISSLFYEEEIPIPEINPGLTEFENFRYVDTTFFTKTELSKIRTLVKSHKVKVILRTLKANRLKIIEQDLRMSIQDAKSVLKSIKEYDPKVRLLYNNVGIIGTALDGYDDVGASSIPMSLTDAEQSIWETDLTLKDGTVKFRTRNSWNQNWGGIGFPKGKAIFYWENIPVSAGNYHIILNLSEKTYEFIKKEN